MVTRHIKLVVTGDMEKASLHDSLRKCFPAQNCHGEDVVWDTPRYANCVTSSRLRQGKVPSNPMHELAKAMLAEALTGKTGNAADLVIVIDDVEIDNLGQESLIAEHFRCAVQLELTKRLASVHPENHPVVAKQVRERCSFHLLRPMVEAYFFGDANALSVSGVLAGTVPQLSHLTNVEDFQSTDPEWLPKCLQINVDKSQYSPWWCNERHPKDYLRHLVEKGGGSYEEKENGERALRGLQWNGVVKTPTDAPIISSLFADVFDWFGAVNTVCVGTPDPQFYVPSIVWPKTSLLRNM